MDLLTNPPAPAYVVEQTETPPPENLRWIFLDIQNPITSWATCRGILVPKNCLLPAESDTPSLFFYSRLRALTVNPGEISRRLYQRELELEQCRAAFFPAMVSRLNCLFTFKDPDRAQCAAEAWSKQNNFFNADCLTRCGVETANESTHDANWIHFGDTDKYPDWHARYWRGDPTPRRPPIWETLSQGRALVHNHDLRQQAFQKIHDWFPDSLPLLELSRMAALLGYDLGAITPGIIGDQIGFVMNAYGIENAAFIRQIIDAYVDRYTTFNSHFFKPDGAFITPNLSRFLLTIK